jgi:hypothetical protein
LPDFTCCVSRVEKFSEDWAAAGRKVDNMSKQKIPTRERLILTLRTSIGMYSCDVAERGHLTGGEVVCC